MKMAMFNKIRKMHKQKENKNRRCDYYTPKTILFPFKCVHRLRSNASQENCTHKKLVFFLGTEYPHVDGKF